MPPILIKCRGEGIGNLHNFYMFSKWKCMKVFLYFHVERMESTFCRHVFNVLNWKSWKIYIQRQNKKCNSTGDRITFYGRLSSSTNCQKIPKFGVNKINMIWRYHVFVYGPHNQLRRWKNICSGFCLDYWQTFFLPSSPIMDHIWKHDLAKSWSTSSCGWLKSYLRIFCRTKR